MPNLLLPSPLQCWWAHPLRIPHVPQTQPSRGPFCKNRTSSSTVENQHSSGHRLPLSDWTHFCWSVGFWMIVFSPSITCCLSWWDSMPVYIHNIVSQALQIKLYKTAITEPEGTKCTQKPTLNRRALEWLCNLVPGFCDLCVLREET